MCIDYFLEYVFIRRAEGIVFYLLRRYPFESAMFEQLRRALGYFRIEHDEVDIYIGILMVDIAEFVADLHCYTELLAAFANECLLMRLARFELSADELPQKGVALVRGAAAYHESVALPDEGGGNLSRFHIFLLFYLSAGLRMKNAVDIITAYIASAAYVAAIGSLNIISSIAARVTHWPMTMTFLPKSFMLSSPDKILGFRARYRL